MTVQRLSQWNVDELMILDISDGEKHDLRRDDLEYRYTNVDARELLRQISKHCSMPVSYGGRIKTVEDVSVLLESGADKCVITTQAVVMPSIITDVAEKFGSQCVIVGIDVKEHPDGRREVYSHKGTRPTGYDSVSWAQEVERRGAGEIFLNFIDRDGMAVGYDLPLLRAITDAVKIPVIACGGVGEFTDFADGIIEGRAHAVAAANIFHFQELSYAQAKRACLERGISMRDTDVENHWIPAQPDYDLGVRDQRIAERLAAAKLKLPSSTPVPKNELLWCTKCVYPSISAAPAAYDENGVCMGCRAAQARKDTPMEVLDPRREKLRALLERYRSKDGARHDCVIAVSGGKDSYYQTHVIKNELGFNPLLITYNGNNYMDVGWRNLMRMREVFGVDHIIYGPSVELLKKLNRMAFIIMGDMNWQGHVGIMTTPMRLAVQMNIPLVIWGEHGYADLCGQFSDKDFVEFTYRTRLEHFGRGYEWNYFVGLEGITEQDMQPYRYPCDSDIFKTGLRGIYLANYLKWSVKAQTDFIIDKYGFEVADKPFERTYRRMSNLDDMHENGVHDYLKYIKFGYGRCSDHVSKDIREGQMTREEGIELIRRLDHVKPSDLQRWLSYAEMDEDTFNRIADTFRNKRVWWREAGVWKKRNIWDI